MGKKFNISRFLKKTFKNKNLSNEEKITSMIKGFYFYYKNIMPGEVRFATYELYYEKFMIDDKHRHEQRYKRFYDFEYENSLYLYATQLNKYFRTFADNVDTEKLEENILNVYTNTLKLAKECKFCKDFNYAAFYYDSNIRDYINEKLKVFEDNIKILANDESKEIFGI